MQRSTGEVYTLNCGFSLHLLELTIEGHILNIEVAPADVSLRPRLENKYHWEVDENQQHLFQKT
jgi:hypothetical protein